MKIKRVCSSRRWFPKTSLVIFAMASCLYLSTRKSLLDDQKSDAVQPYRSHQSQSYHSQRNLPTTPTINNSIPSINTSKEGRKLWLTIPPHPSSDQRTRTLNVQHLMTMAFLIEEPEVCSKIRPEAFLLICVHSAPNRFKNRAQIRKSYGASGLSRALGTVTMFFMGRSKDPEVDRTVRLESARYHDIIMADYIDTYHNLTFKAVSALTWVTQHCGHVPYVLKADDDIFLNIFNVVRYVAFLTKYQMDTPAKGHIYCRIFSSVKPMRNLSDKWYISKEEYPQDKFPPYCSGSAFIMPGFVVPILHGIIPRVPFLWIDDVYVTGMLREETGVIELHGISSVAATNDGEYMAKSALIKGDGLFGHISGDKGLNLRDKYWKELLEKESMELLTSRT